MIEEVLKRQRKYFESGATLNVKYRLSCLKKLKTTIKQYENAIAEALKTDLGKCAEETYMCETGMVLEDLTYHIKHIKKWVKPKKRPSPISQFPSKSYIVPSPYGCTLIISPWNYPFLLSIQPLIGAISAGNTVILKPSRASSATSEIIKKIIEEIFPAEYVAVLYGEKFNSEILKCKFDYIFFTGGIATGKTVYEAAAKTLTPVTLELGGKSPVIIDETANTDLAAKRITFGKFLNAGQTCIAPDYILVNKKIADEFVNNMIKWINKLFPDALKNEKYVKIIDDRHFNRVKNLIDGNIIYGGEYDEEKLKIAPTIIYPANLSDKAMNEEIFGPILPVIPYTDEKEIPAIIAHNPTPLALYLFTCKKNREKEIISKISFGGGCINDVVIHIASTHLPFGGVGRSGSGSYHGKKSFESFSHFKSILKKSTVIDMPIRYTPYNSFKDKLIHFFMK